MAGADLPLTPERVFASPSLAGPSARGVLVSPDGKWVTWQRPSANDQYRLDLWIAPTAGGKARLLVAGEAVDPAGAQIGDEERARRERQRTAALSGIVTYQWDEQSARLLIPAAGRAHLVDAASGQLTVLNTGGDVVDARISPNGRLVSYVRGNNLYVLPVDGGGEQAITSDGRDAVSYGVAEFVAQEEMARHTGYWWDPDGGAIAFARVDDSGVDLVDRLEIGEHGSIITPQRYPKAGRPNARVSLYVQRLGDGAARVEIDLGDNPDIYLARVHWSADGRDLFIERQSRDQTELDLLRADPSTGVTTVIVAERQAPWIDLSDDFRALGDGSFLWGSSRKGSRHLYLYDRDGTLLRAVTEGSAPGDGVAARRVAGVDEEQGIVYFMAAGDTPIEQHLYSVSYRTPQAPRRISSGHGWWTAVMPRSPSCYIGYYSDPETPPRTALFDASGDRLRWIEENPLDERHPFHPFVGRYPAPEFGTLAADDGQSLHYVMLKPVGFDAARSYPAIVQVYGGPGVQSVTRSWRGAAEKLFLEAGYVLFQLDNRGAANRDVRFQAPIARRLGGVEVDDQVVGLEWLRALPFVDATRVGVSGWSYGGYMTLRMMTDPRTHLAAGAAGAPPTDWREYDTHYTERYMGMPGPEAAAYDAAAVIPRLDGLSGRLLLIHGMADDNVLVSNSVAVMAALQSRSTPFDLMLFPGQRHGVQGEARQLHLWRTFLEFFARELGGGWRLVQDSNL